VRIFETVLYAEDLQAAERFYRDVIGLELINRSELVAAFRCQGSVLLIFDPRQSSPAGRDVPSHGRPGPGHLAFAVSEEEIRDWDQRLSRAGVAIEAEVKWELGGRSLYFRDPAGNSIELAPASLWGGATRSRTGL